MRTLTMSTGTRLLAVAGILAAATTLPALDLSAPAVAAGSTSTHCKSVAPDDTDGDGRSDPLIGVPGKTVDGEKKSGEVVVFHGTFDGIKARQALVQGRDGVPGTPAKGNRFGASTQTGDFNGDGCADVAITAPDDRVDSPTGSSCYSAQGAVTVLYGAPGKGVTTRGAQLLTIPSLGLTSYLAALSASGGECTWGDLLNATVGDFNGDGFADLAVVFRASDDDGDEYFLVVVAGSARGLDTAHVTVIPPHSSAQPSFEAISSIAAGDGNGDGRSDLAVGIAGDDDIPGHSQPATVEVIYGAATGLGGGRATATFNRETPGVPGHDPDVDDWDTVAFGDFAGTGYDDLVIDDEEGSQILVLRGSKSGITTKRNVLLEPGHDGVKRLVKQATFGGVLATGDFDHDGHDDLAVGWYDDNSEAGEVTVLAGSRTGFAARRTENWTARTRGLPAPASDRSPSFGKDLQAGNYGRGRGEDLLISSPGGFHGAGSVTELFGAPGKKYPLTTKHSRLITESTAGVPGKPQAGDEFGSNAFL